MVLMKGKLCTHDLASGRTDEVAAAAQLPMVLAMHLDGTNCIWTGHKTGLLALWTEGGPTALCSPLRLDSADIMCAARPAGGVGAQEPGCAVRSAGIGVFGLGCWGWG